MEKLVRGVERFRQQRFTEFQDLFRRLAAHQTPTTLFITCSDSRIDPNLLTQSQPGEMFIMRNAGNLVPPFGCAGEGEGGTIEYAVSALNVQDVVVCGHSRCGAIGGLLSPETLKGLPAVAKWLEHAESTRRIMEQCYPELEGAQRLNAAVEENVLAQLANLQTHPAVAVRLVHNDIRLHGWVYELETGEVYAYDAHERQFVPLAEAHRDPLVERALVRPKPEA